MKRRVPLVLGAATLIFGAIVWWSTPRSDQREAVTALPGAAASCDSVSVDEHELAPKQSLGVARVARLAPTFRGRVMDPNGRPVSAAEISWTRLDSLIFLTTLDQIEGATLTTRSDSRGAFAFLNGFDGTSGASVLWATHVGLKAGYWIRPQDWGDMPVPDLVLEPAPARTARVLESGRAVTGAEVVHRGAYTGRADDRARALSAFFRRSSTDADGTTSLDTLPGEEVVTASRGDLVSAALQGPSQGDVTIELRPSFLVAGKVFLDEPSVPAGAQVLVTDPGSDVQGGLAKVPVTPDGAWGPQQVPLTGSDAFECTLSGGGIIQQTRSADAPGAGVQVRVDFDAQMGLGVRFDVRDEADEPIEGALAIVHWRDGDRWIKSESRPAGKDGLAVVPGCPPASIYFDVRSTGFANFRGGPFLISSPEDSRWTIHLERASRLTGECLHDGKPVTTFKVLYWPSGERAQLRREAVDQDPAGRFELEDVAVGDLSFVVASEGLAQSETSQVTLLASETTHVVVDLPAASDGVGRVLDARTKEPIPGAEIQPYVSGARAMDPLGAPVLAGDDGTFRISGLGVNAVFFSVSSAGYSTAWGQARAGRDGVVALGEFALSPKQPLTIRLIHDAATDPTQFSVETRQGNVTPTFFPAEGVVQMEEFDGGGYEFLLNLPSGEMHELFRTLRPGEPWEVAFDVTSSRRLIVRVVDTSGAGLPPYLWVSVQPDAVPGLRVTSTALSPDGEARVSGLPAGHFQLHIVDEAGETFAAESRSFGDEQELLLRIEVGEARLFRVVDAEGRSVSGGTLWFDVLDGSGRVYRAIVDSAGEAHVQGLPAQNLLVHIDHPTWGVCPQIPVDLHSPSDGAIELEFKVEDSLPIVLMDMGSPAPRVQCKLRIAGSSRSAAFPQESDAAGRVDWGPLGAGDYVLSATHPEYWPVERELHTSSENQVVQIRRRGGITLAVDSLSGRHEGLAVDLVSSEFGASVRAWIEAGLVEASSESLTTDADGRLSVQGLPHGTYRWQILSAEGPVHGLTEVLPGGTATEQVAVP